MNFNESQQLITSTDEEDRQAQHYAMQLVSSSVVPMALKAAIELGVFEIIQRAGPDALLSPSQIASQLPSQSNPKAPLILDQILRLLASHSVLTFSLVTNQQDGRFATHYGLAPVAKHFIRSPGGGINLKDAILLGGNPFKKAHRMSAGFDGLNILVDVGGGNGFVLRRIISKYSSIKGINFDLPQIIENSPSYSGKIIVKHVAGNMFKRVPKGDAIFMKWILHHLDNKQCLDDRSGSGTPESPDANPFCKSVCLMKAERTGQKKNSRAWQREQASLVFEWHVVPTVFQSWSSIKNMRKGKDRKRVGELGFSGFRVACCVYGFSVMELYKNM
ncbi:hypothetical protein GQ457_15G011420 [Hibiscus cannabinus]